MFWVVDPEAADAKPFDAFPLGACPFELLESLRPRTVDAPEVREDKLKAGEVPRLIVSVPGNSGRKGDQLLNPWKNQVPPSPDPEPVELELELAVGEGGVTGSGDRPGVAESTEPANAAGCLLVDSSR